MTYNRCGLVRRDRKRDAPENPLNAGIVAQRFIRRSFEAYAVFFAQCLVGEPDVAELDAAILRATWVCRTARRRRDDERMLVEQLEDAFGCGHGGLQDVVLIG